MAERIARDFLARRFHRRDDLADPGDGLAVNGFWAALVGSLIYSLCGMVIDVLVERLFPGD